MYQKETLATSGQDFAVLVCKNKKGLRDFRIFHQDEHSVDVGYSLVDVRTPVILQYVKNKIRMHHRTYYVLDLKKGKIFRADAVISWAQFDKKCDKYAIILAEYTEAEFRIDEGERFLSCRNVLGDKDYWNTKELVDKENMPGSIHVLDLKERKVHKLPQLIFLN